MISPFFLYTRLFRFQRYCCKRKREVSFTLRVPQQKLSQPSAKALRAPSVGGDYDVEDDDDSSESGSYRQPRRSERRHGAKVRRTNSKAVDPKHHSKSANRREQETSEVYERVSKSSAPLNPVITHQHEPSLPVLPDLEDERMIQVVIRCRPRKRRRHERRAVAASGIRRTQSDWLSSHRKLYDSDDDELSSSSSSDSDLDDAAYQATDSAIEYASDHHRARNHQKTNRRQNEKPVIHIQAHTQGGGVKRRFEFDHVFPPWKKQQEVYGGSVQDQIAHVLRAHEQCRPPMHATIVAYGQTGTGKTYMMGMLSNFQDERQRGIIPRAMQQILDYAETYKSRSTGGRGQELPTMHDEVLVVSMSYLQIYLETIQDLLVFPVDGSAFTSRGQTHKSKLQGADLQVRQRQNQAFYVEGLREYEVTTMEDVQILLETATRNRILASTARNKTSSRSHTLLTISLKRSQRRKREDDTTEDGYASSSSSSSTSSSHGGGEVDNGEDNEAYTVSFVDLAGSERVDETLHFLNTTRRRQELRIREAKFINRSLSALGSVIAALAQPKSSRRSFSSLATTTSGAAFQSSKFYKAAHSRPQGLMTGNGRLLLIATIDDQLANLTETLPTLKFAPQCRRVELQSPRSKAAAKERKDSLLEQVFREMKTTYEEREAQLRRDYQTRILALEQQLASLKTPGPSTLSQPTQVASYVILCALVDQAAGLRLGDQKKQSHPTLESFGSEQEVVKYVTALYVRLQTAIQGATSEQKTTVVSPQPTEKQSVSETDQKQATAGSSSLKCLQHSTNSVARDKSPDSPVRKLQRVYSAPAAATSSNNCDVRPAPKAETVCVNRLKKMRLSAAQEGDFKAIARKLLTSGVLQSYVVHPDDEFDDSFSQIDLYSE
ncbi:Kinesin protein kif7, partial [Globisporangium splendens]